MHGSILSRIMLNDMKIIISDHFKLVPSTWKLIWWSAFGMLRMCSWQMWYYCVSLDEILWAAFRAPSWLYATKNWDSPQSGASKVYLIKCLLHVLKRTYSKKLYSISFILKLRYCFAPDTDISGKKKKKPKELNLTCEHSRFSSAVILTYHDHPQGMLSRW